MSCELLNLANPATEESDGPFDIDSNAAAVDAGNVYAEPPVDTEATECDLTPDWNTQASVDLGPIAGAIIEVPPRPTIAKRPRSVVRSNLALSFALSSTFHLLVAAVALALASRYVLTPQQIRGTPGVVAFGDLTSPASAPNNDVADLPNQTAQPSPPPIGPTDRSALDAAVADAQSQIDNFAQAATDRQISQDVDAAEPAPMIGPQANALAAPAMPKRKAAASNTNATASEAMTASAHAPAERAQSNAAPAVHQHVFGPIRSMGVPGGHRAGFALDERGIPIPQYPDICQRRGEEGTVKLKLQILPDGSVGQILVIDDAGFPRLAAAAVASARVALFGPATDDGRPIVDYQIVPYRFSLR